MKRLLFFFLFLIPFTFNSAELGGAKVTLAWDPNPEHDLAGYRLHYGLTSGQYPVSIDVGNQTEYTITNLNYGVEYFFVATAYNTAGLESDPSNEVNYIPLLPVPQIEGKEND